MCVCVQSLQGSGPGGRVVAQDVSAASPAVVAAPAPVFAPGDYKNCHISLFYLHVANEVST